MIAVVEPEKLIRRLACLAGLIACVFAGIAHGDLDEAVRKALKSADLKKAEIGISIRDASTGSSLLSINGGTPLTPASNMKLLSTGAAMHILGPEFNFRTRMLQQGANLVVVGDGDPAFGDPELLALMSWTDDAGVTHHGMDVDQFLSLWVAAVTKAGITEVDRVIVDDRIFDRQFIPSGWPADQLNRDYCAEVAGLNFHLNIVNFYPKPAKQRPDLTDFHPRASWLRPKNVATCANGPKDKNTAWISRPIGTNEITFHGNVKFAYREPVPVTIHNMPEFFANLLADRLQAAGVKVGGSRVASADDPIPTGTSIGPVIQSSLATVISRCNTDSQNLYAEAILKRSAAAATRQAGTWSGGAAILRHVVLQRVADPALASKLVAVDGSGLSRDNKVAPDLMTAWLNTFHRDGTLSSMFVDSLAVGENGTIRSRFQNIHRTGAVVQCKTGYINKVSCLSGFVTMQDGRRRSFSVLCNNLVEDGAVGKARKLQEAVVQAIAEDMAANAVMPH